MPIKPHKQARNNLRASLKDLINNKSISTQKSLCDELNNLGFNVNQSTISRLLRNIGAIKTKDLNGQIIYCLPKESTPPPTETQLSNLVINIQKNETMVVIHTSPGGAQLISRILDHNLAVIHAIGIISGDDTIFVCPESIENTAACHREVNHILRLLA